MPDGSIINQTTISTRRPKGACGKDQPLMTGAQMRDLLKAYEEAGEAFKDTNGYVQERDEERVSAAFTEAQNRILYARTVDPEGIAIKIKVLDQRGDIAKGLLPEVFADLTRSGASARRIPSRLRPLWEAYQAAWKGVTDAADREDAAMLARGTAPRDSTQAEKDAEANMVRAKTAYEAASEALVSAPTRTFDDAVCRIEHAIDLADEGTNADLIRSLKKALRVLRKTRNASCG